MENPVIGRSKSLFLRRKVASESEKARSYRPRLQTLLGQALRVEARRNADNLPADSESAACKLGGVAANEKAIASECPDSYLTTQTGLIATPCVFLLQQLFPGTGVIQKQHQYDLNR